MIRARERTAIIQSLAAGVVPAVGLQHLQVGREDEVAALVQDLSHIESGGAAFRVIVGRFGAGKTFFLNLIRDVALKRKFAVAQADITTDRRLHGSGGRARSLFSELMANLATSSKPEGSALPSVIERWVGDVDYEVTEAGGAEEDVQREIVKQLEPLRDLPRGYDFATVLTRYHEGFHQGNESLRENAVRWLRAEYTTKTEARQDLGVRSIIDDADVYDALKLLAAFLRVAGYRGFLVGLDELVVLSHRLNNTQSRNNNYEAILRILNDCLQGRAENIGFILAGTDDCLEDDRRGLFSYEALATRLAPNRFATEGRRDLTGPVIQLENLTPEDCFVLLHNVRRVFESENDAGQLVPDEGIGRFLRICQQRMGDDFFRTPRDTVKEFVGLLKVLEQNTGTSWNDLLEQQATKPDESTSEASDAHGGDDLSDFRL